MTRYHKDENDVALVIGSMGHISKGGSFNPEVLISLHKGSTLIGKKLFTKGANSYLKEEPVSDKAINCQRNEQYSVQVGKKHKTVSVHLKFHIWL